MSVERGIDWTAEAKGGVIYMRVTGSLTREMVDATRRLQLVALRQRPSGIGILLDVGETPSLPSSDVRAYATSMAAKYPDGIAAHVTVLGGQGFLPSAIRSALTGIFMVARSPYARAVVASPADAARFLRERMTGGAPDEAEMLRGYWDMPVPDTSLAGRA